MTVELASMQHSFTHTYLGESGGVEVVRAQAHLRQHTVGEHCRSMLALASVLVAGERHDRAHTEPRRWAIAARIRLQLRCPAASHHATQRFT